MPATDAWSDETVFAEADPWYDAVLAAIAAAGTCVAVETYRLADDAVGRGLLAALAAAAARGIEVRLLVDGIGSAAWVHAGAPGAATGVAVRVWHPLPWAIARRAGLATRWRWLSRINRRDHRKLVLVDGARAWTGSANWETAHSRRASGDAAWRDTAATVAGAGVATLAAAFDHTWARGWPLAAGRMRLRRAALPWGIPGHPAVRLNHTLRARHAAYRDLLARLRAARSRIWIANAYVVPRGSLLRALRGAARRGVDVRVLVPGISDHPVMPWIAAAFADSLAAAGARVLAYRPRVLHAKTMLIDATALIGSHNLNSRSFHHDLEVEVVVGRPASIAALERAWAEDEAQADRLVPPALAALRWWQRWAARLALLGKRWL